MQSPSNLPNDRTCIRLLVLSCLLTSLLNLLASQQVLADFTGSVVSIIDGDTIEVLHNTHPERIRRLKVVSFVPRLCNSELKPPS